MVYNINFVTAGYGYDRKIWFSAVSTWKDRSQGRSLIWMNVIKMPVMCLSFSGFHFPSLWHSRLASSLGTAHLGALKRWEGPGNRKPKREDKREVLQHHIMVQELLSVTEEMPLLLSEIQAHIFQAHTALGLVHGCIHHGGIWGAWPVSAGLEA